jgi:hypothetical protein
MTLHPPTRYSMQDARFKMLDAGFWMLDLSRCSRLVRA